VEEQKKSSGMSEAIDRDAPSSRAASAVTEKVELVEGLFERGILDEGRRVSKQPGRCCTMGCQVPEPPRGQVPVLETVAE
jgi:hypothetical protein